MNSRHAERNAAMHSKTIKGLPQLYRITVRKRPTPRCGLQLTNFFACAFSGITQALPDYTHKDAGRF